MVDRYTIAHLTILPKLHQLTELSEKEMVIGFNVALGQYFKVILIQDVILLSGIIGHVR